jgi:hypothetical protein
MASWKQLEKAAPEIAAGGIKLLYQFGVGLGFLATVRKDGAPRLHPICPTVFEGALYGLILPSSHKRHDLVRDGRYALHTFAPVENDDEFLVTGRARLIADAQLVAAVRADQMKRGMTSTHDEDLFEFSVERAMFAKYPGGHGTWPPKYHVWKER